MAYRPPTAVSTGGTVVPEGGGALACFLMCSVGCGCEAPSADLQARLSTPPGCCIHSDVLSPALESGITLLCAFCLNICFFIRRMPIMLSPPQVGVKDFLPTFLIYHHVLFIFWSSLGISLCCSTSAISPAPQDTKF